MTVLQLHQRALETVKNYYKLEAELIDLLQKIDTCRGYRNFGAPSLFVYATQVLKLSEATAYNFITVARKAKEIPALKSEIASGALSVSRARKIAPVLNRENQSQWIELAKRLPREKLEKEVAKVSPKAAVPERLRYVTETRIEFKCGISEELMAVVRRAQDLLSQKKQKAASLEETLHEVFGEYVERCDPVKKAERATQRKPVPGQATTAIGTDNRQPHTVNRRLSAPLRHNLALRDQSQCTGQNPDGTRCTQRRWLDLHHVHFKGRGGTNTLGNLTTLCRSHHQLVHARAP